MVETPCLIKYGETDWPLHALKKKDILSLDAVAVKLYRLINFGQSCSPEVFKSPRKGSQLSWFGNQNQLFLQFAVFNVDLCKLLGEGEEKSLILKYNLDCSHLFL